MALAVEQEMKAKTQAAKARVLESESQVPQAIAEAFRQGKLGIMDYYRMRNVQADTSMRSSIGEAAAESDDDDEAYNYGRRPQASPTPPEDE